MGKLSAVLGAMAAVLTVTGCESRSTRTPGGTTADPTLQRDVSNLVLLYDSAVAKQCKDRKIVDTAVIEMRSDGHTGAERWTVDQCGKVANYRVIYSPDGKGGTFFGVQPEK
jgi:hypothetical protein